MANTITIRKKGVEVAAWRFNALDATPATKIDVDDGLVALVNIENAGAKLLFGPRSVTLYSILNPGKDAPFFGKNKVYDSVEIVVIDQSGKFNAEWGFGGVNGVTYYDDRVDIERECKLSGFGNYFYKVEEYYNFMSMADFDENGIVSRESIREFLRDEASGIIKSYITSALAKVSLEQFNMELTTHSEAVKNMINEKLRPNGIDVYNFVIGKLGYPPEHQAIVDKLNAAKDDMRAKQRELEVATIDTEITKKKNEGALSDVAVEEAIHEIGRKDMTTEGDVKTKIIHGYPKAEKPVKEKEEPKKEAPKKKTIECRRCRTENDADAVHCKKCGDFLTKK